LKNFIRQRIKGAIHGAIRASEAQVKMKKK